MNNLHISLTEFRNESRVLKTAGTLIDEGIVDKVFIAALHGVGLSRCERYRRNIVLNRFQLRTRRLSRFFLAQLIKYVEFCVRVLFFYKAKDVRIVNVHSLGVLPLGVLFKLLYKTKLVYDTHELETERDGLTGFRKFISKFLERFLIRHVDLTFVVSESIADWYAETYEMPRPLVVLNVPRKRQLTPTHKLRLTFGLSTDQTLFLYQGGLMSGRGVGLILEAFKQRSDHEAVMIFMGYGELEEEIKHAAYRHSNIFYHPAVPPELLLDYTASADVGLHLIQNSCLNHYFCMPNKLFEYAMAGLPVLVSNMKDMSELVRQNSMGEVIDEFSPRGINAAIDRFSSLDLSALRRNAYRVACENAWDVQAKKIGAAYRGMVRGMVGMSEGGEV